MVAAFVNTRGLSTGSIGAIRQRRMLILAAATIAASIGMARLVLMFDLGSITVVYGLIAIGAVLVRPRFGLYIVVAMVLAFESSRSWDPLMEPGRYFSTSPQESIRLPGAILFPLEMGLLLATATWLCKGAVNRRLDFRAGPLGTPMLLFVLSLVVGVMHGFMAGGVFNFVLWETRFLFAMVLSFVLTTNVIRTRGHIQTLMTLIMIGVGFSSIEGIWRKFAL